MSTERIETFRRSQPWRPEETSRRKWHKKSSVLTVIGVVLGFTIPILVWMIETGWFNMPPKAYELNNVKDDVSRIEKRLDTLDNRINRLDEKIDRKLDGITTTLEGLAVKTAETGAKVDALSVAQPTPAVKSPPAPPKKASQTRMGQR